MTVLSSLMLVLVTAAIALGLAAVTTAVRPLTETYDAGKGALVMAGYEQEPSSAPALVLALETDGSLVNFLNFGNFWGRGARQKHRTEATLFTWTSDRALASSAPVQPIATAAPFAPVGQARNCIDRDCKSPLYPQNGVTLWDRIRSSANGDQRANLLGIGIQVHVPSVAATPGPVKTRQYRCSGNHLCDSPVADQTRQRGAGD